VDLIVAMGAAILPARQATDLIPIVLVGGGDPVMQGVAASYAHPGGNVTGIPAVVSGGVAPGKRLELLKLVAPGVSRVTILGDANATLPVSDYEGPAAAAAQALGLELQVLGIGRPDDLTAYLQRPADDGAEGLLVVGSLVLSPFLAQITDLALRHRLPSMGSFREFPASGGLMAYGPTLNALERRAGYYVDRILKGAKPADLPIEQPMTFDFVVNLKTARELGITFPNEIMLQVTEVIDS
jgi:putative ABC transport system substrate-binding protein